MARKGGTPENLRPPYKKGQSGNPNGRPRVLPELKEALQKILAEEKDGMTALDAVLKTLRNRALKGDVRAIQEILDRFYGKVKQEHSLEGIPPAININVTSQETAEKLKKYLNGS